MPMTVIIIRSLNHHGFNQKLHSECVNAPLFYSSTMWKEVKLDKNPTAFKHIFSDGLLSNLVRSGMNLTPDPVKTSHRCVADLPACGTFLADPLGSMPFKPCLSWVAEKHTDCRVRSQMSGVYSKRYSATISHRGVLWFKCRKSIYHVGFSSSL